MSGYHDPNAEGYDPLANVEAEQCLLGALLINNAVYDRVATIVTAENFFDPVHGHIYEAAVAMIQRDETASPVTLKAHFAEDPGLAELGGPAYLVRLAGAAISIFACADYARVVADLAQRRALRATLQESLAAVNDPDTAIVEVTGKVESWTLAEAGRSASDSNVVSFRAAVTDTIRRLNAVHMGEAPPGLMTGIKAVDGILNMGPGDMVVIAGRPSMGKSAMALQIAMNVARGVPGQEAMGVGIASLEMNQEQLVLRALAESTAVARHGIPYRDIRNAQDLSETQMLDVHAAARELGELPIFITKPAANTPGAIMAASRQIVRRFEKAGQKLGLLVIDYIQLMKSASRGNRTEQVTELSNATKAIATHLGIPVLALAQLSRAVEERDDKRPLLSDLRDSGAIEQDADTVIFPFREEYYLERSKPTKPDALMAWHETMAACAGKLDFIVAKQRMGPIGTVRVDCDIELNWIRDGLGERPRPDVEGFA
jgi:replicative DNA helicase